MLTFSNTVRLVAYFMPESQASLYLIYIMAFLPKFTDSILNISHSKLVITGNCLAKQNQCHLD
jgi:hypothetical protein